MSKEAEARVRDELLQSLYASMLRCTLAPARGTPGGAAGEAVAAGVCANLRADDLVLLPRLGSKSAAAGFRVLRGLPTHPTPPARELAAGVLPLPTDEAQAVSFAMGAAAAAAHAGLGALVCAVLPLPLLPEGTSAGARTHRLPTTWHAAGAYAARMALPLLLVTGPDPRRLAAQAAVRPAHRLPAPLFPSIPVDREDALAIYRVAFECAARARAGGGPSRLACVPFRVAGQPRQAPDALGRIEAMLRKRGAFPKAWQRQLERRLLRELSE